MSNETRLPYRCDAVPDFGRYEYKTTEGQRKCWDGDPDLTKEGWEEWAEWERFDFTEERYWRRPLSDEQIAEAQRAKADRATDAARTTAKIEAEQAVIEAAEALVGKNPMGMPSEAARSWIAIQDAVRALQEALDE